jgi:ribosome-associated translation inhibitor RaiA
MKVHDAEATIQEDSMQTPVQVAFRDVPSSAALESAIRDEAAALERYFDRITSCHVTVSEPHRHQHTNRLYSVHIRLLVPGEELMIAHEHRLHPGHADPYLAAREAFHAARRSLEDYVRRMRGEVKHHKPAKFKTGAAGEEDSENGFGPG